MSSFHCSPTLGAAGPIAIPAPVPTESCLDFTSHVPREFVPAEPSESEEDPDPAETPANSKKTGSFNYDQEKGGYVHKWANLAEFDVWRRQEELAYSIDLVISKTLAGRLYTQKRTYVCSRQQTGGERNYQRKFPDRKRKIESKKTGCSCQITIKLYPHTRIVLGRYDSDHDHEIGLANIAYTRISRPAREKIIAMLTQKVDHREIVCKRSLFFNNKSDTSTDS
jgi:hypothetical protein